MINLYDNSILIIGKGESKKNRNIAVKYTSLDKVQQDYGMNSELTLAFKEALETGATNVYLYNASFFTDYIDSVKNSKNKLYTYVCPLFDIFEIYTDTANENSIYLVEKYLFDLQGTFTKIIATSSHCSLFKNIEHSISQTLNALDDYKENRLNINNENLFFVINNLKNYQYANIVLASILTQNNFKHYPSNSNLGDVVFNYEEIDFLYDEVIFFKFNSILGSTIENLYNLSSKENEQKYIPNLIISDIIRSLLNYKDLVGKLYSNYVKIAIENHTLYLLNELEGKLIDGYRINDISVIKDSKTKTVSINIEMQIKTYLSVNELIIKKRI